MGVQSKKFVDNVLAEEFGQDMQNLQEVLKELKGLHKDEGKEAHLISQLKTEAEEILSDDNKEKELVKRDDPESFFELEKKDEGLINQMMEQASDLKKDLEEQLDIVSALVEHLEAEQDIMNKEEESIKEFFESR